MAYIKAAIFTILALLVGLVGYMYFTFDSAYELDIAYEQFLKGNYRDAQQELSKLQDSLPPGELQLYQAYVQRALKNLPESDKLLSEAALQSRQRKLPELQLEILLNRALNAYLQNDLQALNIVLEQAQSTSLNHPWVIFFQALERYMDEDWAEALELWSLPYHRLPLSGWMKKSFDQVFTQLWMVIHLTRCQIEEGKYLLARQTLEEEMDVASGEELTDINFLLGLSYAREAQEKPITAAAPYYKLAFSYFSKVPMDNPRYFPEKQRLMSTLLKASQDLIHANAYQDLTFYTSILQQWSAEEELEQIATEVTELLQAEIAEKNWRKVRELTALLHRLLPDGNSRDQLAMLFRKRAAQALEENDLEALNEFWSAAHMLSDDSVNLTQQFTAGTLKKIRALLPLDDSSLSLTKPYINFWKTIQDKPEERTKLASQLSLVAEELWLQPKGEKKATALMEAALSLAPPSHKGQVQQGLGQMISRVYQSANRSENIEKLPYILDAIEELNLNNVDIQEKAQAHKHLASARDFLSQGQYQEALRRVDWVLQLEPENQQARLLAGQVLFQLANYEKALEYLSLVVKPDLDALEKIAISQILIGQTTEGTQLIEEVKSRRPLKQDSLLRLGLGNLTEGETAEGRKWLLQRTHRDPETLIGLAFAAYQQGDLDEVTELLAEVPAPYKALDSTTGILIQTEIENKAVETAEKQLIGLLNQPSEPDVSGMSPPFQTFLRGKLGEFGRYYIAGLFFRNVKKNDDIAIKYFKLVKNPSPIMRVTRGETYLDLGRYDHAEVDLRAAAQQDADPEAKLEAMPRLAVALARQDKTIEALSWFQRYFQLAPDQFAFRGEYAEVLRQLRRYDLALQQYKLLGDWDQFQPNDIVGFVDTLVRTNRFEDANKAAEKWLQADPPLPLVDALGIARLMVITNNQEATWGLLRALPSVKQLTKEQTIELIYFLMEIGSFHQALQVVEAKKADLDRSVSGLLVQAELNEKLSRYTDAVAFARQARILDPSSIRAATALGEYARDIATLENLAMEFERLVEKNPSSIQYRILYGQRMADLGFWARATEEEGHAPYQADLQKAYFLVDRVSQEQPDIPEVYNVLGQLLTLLDKPKAALESYYKAIQLDPSYASAYRHMAHLYKRLGDDRSAIRALYQATKFDPDSAQAWQRLGTLYEITGNLYEASTFYQNAIKHNPNDIRNYLQLGKVFLELRNPEDARTILDHALSLSPNNIPVLALLLEVLHDNLLIVSVDDDVALRKQQQDVYQQLYKLDAQKAEKVLSEFKSPRANGWEDRLPPIDNASGF